MGLDISVYKPVKKGESEDNFFFMREAVELESFKHLAFEQENEYFNLDEAAEKLGHKLEDLEWRSMGGGDEDEGELRDDFIYKFSDKKHKLYVASKWLDEVWSHTYFKTIEELQISEYYKKFKSEFLNLLTENGWKEEYAFHASGSGEDYFNLVSAWKYCRKVIEVKLINPPKYKQMDLVIAVKEVGYQRKGANKQFYEDGMWDSKCITNLSVLKEHHEKYFSKSTPESKGGWGSGVEFDLADEEMKKRFQENIVDKFVEGETFVIYH